MKKIDAIIQRFKLDAVKKELLAKGVEGMTITEVHNVGEETLSMTYRGVDKVIDSVPKIRVETIVPDQTVEQVIDTIFQSAHTGNPGDGQIVVTNIESVTRIRTGETDDRDEDFVRHIAELRMQSKPLPKEVVSPYQFTV